MHRRGWAFLLIVGGTANPGWGAADYSGIQKALGIPAAVAAVVDAAETPDRLPQVILIQDIHRHTEAQQNIAAIILHGLRHWNTQEIFVEGSWADDDTLKTSMHRYPSLLQAVREGRLGGAELAVGMAPDQNFRFLGLEDREVYRQNVAAFDAVEKARDKALSELDTAKMLTHIFDAVPPESWTLVKRLIQLRLKPSEYMDYSAHRFQAPTDSWLANAVSSAERFYELANARSHIFLEKSKTLHQSGTQVLVIGGFHTTLMAEELRRNGISYVVLSPRVTQTGFEELYAQGMHDTVSALKLR